MFLSILIGYFEQFIFVFLLIFVHELGHFETAKIFKYKVDKIYLYPTGGISKFTSELNASFIKELLVLLNGPSFNKKYLSLSKIINILKKYTL